MVQRGAPEQMVDSATSGCFGVLTHLCCACQVNHGPLVLTSIPQQIIHLLDSRIPLEIDPILSRRC